MIRRTTLTLSDDEWPYQFPPHSPPSELVLPCSLLWSLSGKATMDGNRQPEDDPSPFSVNIKIIILLQFYLPNDHPPCRLKDDEEHFCVLTVSVLTQSFLFGDYAWPEIPIPPTTPGRDHNISWMGGGTPRGTCYRTWGSTKGTTTTRWCIIVSTTPNVFENFEF